MIEAVGEKRDYTMKIYESMRRALCRKAKELGPNWTAEMVGKALWVKAILSVHGEIEGAVSEEAVTTGKRAVASDADADAALEEAKNVADTTNVPTKRRKKCLA